jgi:hypothetical protein
MAASLAGVVRARRSAMLGHIRMDDNRNRGPDTLRRRSSRPDLIWRKA